MSALRRNRGRGDAGREDDAVGTRQGLVECAARPGEVRLSNLDARAEETVRLLGVAHHHPNASAFLQKCFGHEGASASGRAKNDDGLGHVQVSIRDGNYGPAPDSTHRLE